MDIEKRLENPLFVPSDPTEPPTSAIPNADAQRASVKRELQRNKYFRTVRRLAREGRIGGAKERAVQDPTLLPEDMLSDEEARAVLHLDPQAASKKEPDLNAPQAQGAVETQKESATILSTENKQDESIDEFAVRMLIAEWQEKYSSTSVVDKEAMLQKLISLGEYGEINKIMGMVITRLPDDESLKELCIRFDQLKK